MGERFRSGRAATEASAAARMTFVPRAHADAVKGLITWLSVEVAIADPTTPAASQGFTASQDFTVETCLSLGFGLNQGRRRAVKRTGHVTEEKIERQRNPVHLAQRSRTTSSSQTSLRVGSPSASASSSSTWGPAGSGGVRQQPY